jgi:WD40 repeat protein/predicted Ser/Thr protein kinase
MTPKSTAQRCSQCGADLAAATATGLCPRCLLSICLDETVGPDPLLALPNAVGKASSFGSAVLPAFGSYELLAEIARGGMGVVYKARQIGLNRLVAIKMLLAGPFASPEFLARFRTEAETAAKLRHPNIVSILEVGQHEGLPYFSMEYVEGPNLAQLVQDGPLEPKRAATCVHALAEAVQYAHDLGVLHRDLKPSNVLVDMFGQPRITDFGLAKQLSGSEASILTRQLTLTGQMLGSPAFMAPEQAAGDTDSIGRASDIYSLGAVVYWLLTCRPPHLGSTLGETIRSVQEDEPVPPRRLNRAVPLDLETICLKCLEKDPSRRYATAKKLADDLGRFLADEPVHARAVGRTEKVWRWCRRKPALASLAASVLVLVVLLAVGAPIAAFRINRERQRAEAQAYTAEMNNVLQAWKEGQLKRAEDLLSAYIPKPGRSDLRGFEWRYLWKLCQDESLHTIQCGTNDQVWRLVSSPGQSFVAACGQNAVRLLDPATGQELHSFAYPNPEAKHTSHLIALAQATNLLAAHRAGGVVGLWDLARKSLLGTVQPFTNNLTALALSPDGTRLAARDGRNVGMWDISRPTASRPMWSLQLDVDFGPAVLKFSPDGKTLVGNGRTIQAGTIAAWDGETGRELPSFPKHSVGFVDDVAFSPDGTLLAASGIQTRIDIWDFTNRTVSYPLEGHFNTVNALAFSPDGKRLISAASDGTIRVWDVQSRKAVGIFRDPEQREVLSAAFAPDGKSILSTTVDELKIWNPEPRPPAAVIETRQTWGWPAISPDGKWLVTLWGANKGEAYVESESVKVWDVASRQLKFYLVHKDRQPVAPVFSPDGKLFVVGGEDPERRVSVWETALWASATGPLNPIASFTNEFEVGSIAFSPDGKIMAMAGMAFNPQMPSGATNRLAFREVGSWRKLGILEGAGAGATERAAAATVAFSNDGRLLAVGYRDGWVRLWDFERQRLLKELNVHDDAPFLFGGVGVNFSADGRWLAAVSLGASGNLELFDLMDLRHIRPGLTTSGLYSALFTSDSRTLVTSGGDGLIKFWNLETLKLAMTLEHTLGLASFLSLSPDGNLLVSQDADGLVKLWPAAPLEEIEKVELAKSLGR